MKEYEIAFTYLNGCAGAAYPQNSFEEVAVANTDDYIRSKHRKEFDQFQKEVLPSGQIEGGRLEVLLSDSDTGQGLHGTFFAGGFIQSQIPRTEHHIREHVRLKELVLRILKNKADLRAQGPLVVILFMDIFSIVEDPSLRRFQKPVQELDQRGFAGAGVADQADKLIFRDLQAHILQGCRLHGRPDLVYIADVFQFDSHAVKSLSTETGCLHMRCPARL